MTRRLALTVLYSGSVLPENVRILLEPERRLLGL